MYQDYNNNFFTTMKRTVYKWWCVVYKPVYKLIHQGRWPEEKEPYVKYPKLDAAPKISDADAEKLAQQLLAEKDDQVAKIVASVSQENTVSETSAEVVPNTDQNSETEPDPSAYDEDALAKANEIMARLAREAAEDEAKKNAEIEEAKRKAAEQERLAQIMKKNQIDISPYIEEGKAHQNEAKSEN